MPFLIARAPGRKGIVFAFAFRSRAAVELERSGESPGPMLKRLGRGGSSDLMPKCRFGKEALGLERRKIERGRRKGGGSGIATKAATLLGILSRHRSNHEGGTLRLKALTYDGA